MTAAQGKEKRRIRAERKQKHYSRKQAKESPYLYGTKKDNHGSLRMSSLMMRGNPEIMLPQWHLHDITPFVQLARCCCR